MLVDIPWELARSQLFIAPVKRKKTQAKYLFFFFFFPDLTWSSFFGLLIVRFWALISCFVNIRSLAFAGVSASGGGLGKLSMGRHGGCDKSCQR